jgi:O-antigen/teichoic acid export membrane protein
MLVTCALAPAIAWFYDEPRLSWITLALASAFIFGGLTVQHQALLRRQMRFGSLALIEVISLLVSIIPATVAAWYGMGYWALVIMCLAEAISSFVAVWVACRWCPGLPVRRSGVRKMLAFGGNITGFNIVHYFFRNLDNVLIGKFCGPLALGLYSKAYKIMMLPVEQIRTPLNMVALPALSSLQKEPTMFTRYYSKLVSFIAFASMPLVAFLGVCSDNIIRLLLGNQWLDASVIFRVMALAAFIQPVAGTRGAVLLSLGQSGRYLKWGVFQSIVTAVSFIIGLRWGVIGVALSFTISSYLLLFPSLWYCFRLTPISTTAFLKAISRSTIASLWMAVVVYFGSLSLVGQPDIMTIVICFAFGSFAYFLAWFLMPSGIERLREILSVFSLVFQRRGKSQEEGQ